LAKLKGKAKMTRRSSESGRFVEVINRKNGVWILRDTTGKIRALKSSQSANTAMDLTVSKYARVLRRLADR
jgi:hypothetical protein